MKFKSGFDSETIGKEALDHVCGDAASFYDDNHTKYRESCQKKRIYKFFPFVSN